MLKDPEFEESENDFQVITSNMMSQTEEINFYIYNNKKENPQ